MYDHKRMHKEVQKNPDDDMLYVWDFALRRDDGTELFLHPNWNDTNIACYSANAYDLDIELPNSGMGGTSGAGTFKYFKDKKTERTMKFDIKPKAKGKGKGKGKVNSTISSTPQAICDR